MKTLKYAILLFSIFACSNNFAKSPHESDSSTYTENIESKVMNAEYDHLNGEVSRLRVKLENTLSSIPLNIESGEGKVISIITSQVERDIEAVRKDIESINYQKTSDPIYIKLEQIEKDIEMI